MLSQGEGEQLEMFGGLLPDTEGNGKIGNLVKMDNLVKVTESSPVYREVPDWFFHRWEGSHLNLSRQVRVCIFMCSFI